MSGCFLYRATQIASFNIRSHSVKIKGKAIKSSIKHAKHTGRTSLTNDIQAKWISNQDFHIILKLSMCIKLVV